MNYVISRHFARYEYVVESGYVTGKNVADIGGGMSHGSIVLAMKAASVTCIDPHMKAVKDEKYIPYVPQTSFEATQRVYGIPNMFENIAGQHKWDVGVCIEVFEHVPNPSAFCKLVAQNCKEVFWTTPLVAKTGKTINPDHFCEYDKVDFMKILGESFDILDYKIQMPDMTVVDHAEPLGFSCVAEHRVQMAWCKSRLLSSNTTSKI